VSGRLTTFSGMPLGTPASPNAFYAANPKPYLTTLRVYSTMRNAISQYGIGATRSGRSSGHLSWGLPMPVPWEGYPGKWLAACIGAESHQASWHFSMQRMTGEQGIPLRVAPQTTGKVACLGNCACSGEAGRLSTSVNPPTTRGPKAKSQTATPRQRGWYSCRRSPSAIGRTLAGSCASITDPTNRWQYHSGERLPLVSRRGGPAMRADQTQGCEPGAMNMARCG